MEGSQSEAVFSSLNLNPQIFVNETLNTVDDLFDEAFDFFHQEASGRLQTEGTERAHHLKEGINSVRYMVQSGLDKRLEMWEKYCLHHCFAVPEGFSLHNTNESPKQSSTSQDLLSDPALDSQLDSLRERLAEVSRQSVELNRELQDLERKSTATDRCNELLAEVFQSYDKNSADSLFQEMLQTASEFRGKLENLQFPRPEDTGSSKVKIGDISSNLETLEEFLGKLKEL
ncbi:unnamed protein product [Linum trigynum]|uniref:Uncharacterized protein n=1 Tax=Linum trigynum TaxID=586398 RepID=A0AAV2D8Z6_9ROSI